MSRTSDAKLRALARELDLDSRGDCARRIRDYAVQRVRAWSETFSVDTVQRLLELVAGCLSLKVVYIEDDTAIARIARKYGAAWSGLEARLHLEFVRGETMGCLLAHPNPETCGHRYYAFVDARGDRGIRAYFTAWHEVAHLLVQPPQLSLVFRRTLAPGSSKDPIEALVDEIAGELAFFEPFVQPELERELGNRGRLSLSGIGSIREAVAPELSFQAAAYALVRLGQDPAAFLVADEHLKPTEQRKKASDQLQLITAPEPEPKLRVSSVLPNQAMKDCGFAIFRDMRVPEASVIADAFEGKIAGAGVREEEQNDWESGGSRLDSLPLRIEAARFGPVVYALLTAR